MVAPFPLDGPKSGSRIRAEGILRTLTTLGAQVDYAYLDTSQSRETARPVPPGIGNVVAIPHRVSAVRLFMRMVRGLSYRRAKFWSPAMAEFLKRNAAKYDVVWINFLDGFYEVLAGGAPYVVVDTHNDDIEWYRMLAKSRRSLLVRVAALWSASRVRKELVDAAYSLDALIAVSEEDLSGLLREAGRRAPGKECVVLPNCIPRAHFNEPSPSLVERTIDLSFIGSLGIEMNHNAAMVLVDEIAPQLRRKIDAVVTIAGSSPRSALVRAVERQAGCRLISNPLDVSELYRHTKIFIMPFWEGGGTKLKYIEAAARGCLILSTPVGVRGLGVTPGKHFVLCRDVKEFVDAAYDALVQLTDVHAVAEANWAFCREKFTWEGLTETSLLEVG